eukprot:5981062-Amphidinium_carterae.1
MAPFVARKVTQVDGDAAASSSADVEVPDGCGVYSRVDRAISRCPPSCKRATSQLLPDTFQTHEE